MKLKPYLRYGLSVIALAAAGTMLSGCLGDPTYGTGKTQTAQLVSGLGNLVSLPKDKGAGIKYRPRAGIVEPPKSEDMTLPPPEQNVASKNDPRWPESPEQVRKRMVAKINAESGNVKRLPLGASPRMWDGGRPANNSDAQTKQFRQALTIEQGTYTARKFLSDPPANLKQPASTAPTNQLGKPERQKERERLAAAKKKGSGSSWWPF